MATNRSHRPPPDPPVTSRRKLPGGRIGMRLFLTGAVLVLVTGLIVALMGATIARQSLLAEAESRVMALVEQREAHLRDWLDTWFTTARHLVRAVHPQVAGGTEELHGVLQSLPGLRRAAMLDLQGRSMIAYHALAWQPDPVAVNAARLTGLRSYGPVHRLRDGEPVFDVVQPIELADGDSALLALRLNSREVLDPILTDTSGLGLRGELFLLDRDMRMLTPSRRHDHPDPLSHTMDIPPARMALQQQQRGSLQYTSFLGQPVVGAYSYLPVPRWILVGELDMAEALAPVREIYIRSAVVLLVALVLLMAVTLQLARSWARPIVRLTRASERVAAGDYSVQLHPRRSRDEISTLSDSFNRMVAALAEGREELQQAQHQLVLQERMAAVGRLVSSIVHEMRNPLSSIKMNLRLLQRRLPDEDPLQREHLDLASDEVRRLEAMLQELLDYGRPVEPDRQELDPRPLLEAVLSDLADYAAEHEVELRVDPVEEPVSVCTDRELLRRSLENLVRNAVEACEAGGSVTLGAVAEDDRVTVYVTDTGKGMNETVRRRLFDPFFTTRERGTGLGMSNVRKFVEAMQGEIGIESDEGRGSTIRLTFSRR